MNFNNIFEFIENEEDFLNFVAIYKNREFEGNNLILFNSKLNLKPYNYLVFKTNKNNIKDFEIKIDKYVTKIEYKEFEGLNYINKKIIEFTKDDIINIENMILKYKNEIKKSMLHKNKKKLLLNFADWLYIIDNMNVDVAIDEDIFNFIKNENCLQLYMFFLYYTYRLENNIEWFRLSKSDICIVLNIKEYRLNDYINILINNRLIDRRKVQQGKGFYYEYRIIPYEEFMQIKSNNFICDSSNKDKNTKSKKEKMIIEKDKSMINIPSMYYIVYEITDLTNGMKYIGKHKTTNINDGYMGSGRLLKQNQEIKGIENFEKKILHLCKNDKHMAEMEAMEIEKVKAYENNMYYNLKKEK